MPHQVVLRALFVIAFVICIPNITNAQLKSYGNSGQVLVDLSVLDELSAGPPSNARISIEHREGGILKPPAKMPRSHYMAKHTPAKTSVNLSRIKLKPITKMRKKGTSSLKLLKKTKKLKPRPRVLKKKNLGIKTSKHQSPKHLSSTSKRNIKKPAKLPKVAPNKPLTDKVVIAPAPKAIPKAPVKILATPPPNPKITKTMAKTKAISREVAALPRKRAQKSMNSMLIFKQGEAKLTNEAKITLDKLSAKLKVDPNSRMQLQAYAGERDLSASRARRLSLSRALSARSYLIKKGIRSTRIDVRALGNKVSVGEPNRVDLKFIKN